jgi:predicted aspartyl protease
VSTKRFWIVAIAFLGSLSVLLWILVQHGSPGKAPAPEPSLQLPYDAKNQRAALLKQKGYLEVPLLTMNCGYLYAVAQVNGEHMLFCLDSGCNVTTVDQSVAQRRKLPSQPSDRIITGVGGKTTPLPKFTAEKFILGELERNFHAYLRDLSGINKVLLERKDLPEDGVLGADFLMPLAPVIDYGSARLFLRPAAQGTFETGTALAALLKAQKYVEVPLLVDKLGLLQVAANINGESVLFQVDTGAMDAEIDKTVAARLKLPTKETSIILQGLGGEVSKVNKVSLEKFSVQSVQRPLDMLLDDLSGVNAALQQEGGSHYDGLLGATFLAPLSAVIDYGSAKMFLLDPKRN